MLDNSPLIRSNSLLIRESNKSPHTQIGTVWHILVEDLCNAVLIRAGLAQAMVRGCAGFSGFTFFKAAERVFSHSILFVCIAQN